MQWWKLGLVNRHEGDQFSPVELHCPYCRNKENFVRVFRSERRGDTLKEDHFSDLWQCQSCSELMFVQWYAEGGKVNFRVYPSSLRHHGLEDVLPEPIVTEYQQALDAFVAENWDVAVLLLRRVIDLVGKDAGGHGKALTDLIHSLVKSGILTKRVSQWADQITLLHPQQPAAESMTLESTRELLVFTRWILDMVYTLPHNHQHYRGGDQ